MALQFTPAQTLANKMINDLSTMQANIQNRISRFSILLASGQPAQNGQPAVAAADIATALGSNLTTVQAAITALSTAINS
jgi:hypothetical protein